MDTIEWTFTTRSHHPHFFLLLHIYLLHEFTKFVWKLYTKGYIPIRCDGTMGPTFLSASPGTSTTIRIRFSYRCLSRLSFHFIISDILRLEMISCTTELCEGVCGVTSLGSVYITSSFQPLFGAHLAIAWYSTGTHIPFFAHIFD